MNKSPYNMENTLEIAQNKFAKCNPQTMAELSGCLYDENTGIFTVTYLGQAYMVTYPAGKVSDVQQKEADLTTAILILHYLSGASGVKPAEKWISFKELPSGAIYREPFFKRAIKPFIKVFGNRPEAFAKAAEFFGGKKTIHGDLSYIIPILPRIAIMVILWQGDEEFPSNGNILFDQHISSYMHTEDCAHLASMAVYGMMKVK